MNNTAAAPINHPYSPSNVPSVDGFGCLHREQLADASYSLVTCKAPEHFHQTVEGLVADIRKQAEYTGRLAARAQEYAASKSVKTQRLAELAAEDADISRRLGDRMVDQLMVLIDG